MSLALALKRCLLSGFKEIASLIAWRSPRDLSSACSTQAVAANVEELKIHALDCFRAHGQKDAIQDEWSLRLLWCARFSCAARWAQSSSSSLVVKCGS